MKLQELEQKYEELGKEIEKLKNEKKGKRWKPELGDSYWCLGWNGEVNQRVYNGVCQYSHDWNILQGNCFQTEEEAEEHLENLKTKAELRALAEELNGDEVTEVRYNEVYNKFRQKLNDWTPTFNNLRGLYQKFGQDWRFVPIPEAHGISKEEAWKDMPKEAIAYIASLPEFDREMFKEITGIEVAND